MTAARCPGEGGGRRKQPTDFDLFPDSLPPVTPAIWPMPGTRAAEALRALLCGPVNQAEYAHGRRLAASVYALSADGWAIDATSITRPGCRAPIALYSLNRDDPSTRAALDSKGVTDERGQ